MHKRNPTALLAFARVEKQPRPVSLLAKDVEDPVVYFIRTTDGLIKIGWTSDIASRKRFYGSGWEHILALHPGTRDDERALHQRFAEHTARGREYFHPAPELIDHINAIRDAANVPPVDM